MNVFGAFGFGSLIKTFLPGFVLFFVFLIYLDLFIYLTHDYVKITQQLLDQPALFAAIAIPVSIIFGVTLNSIVFSGLSEFLLENRHEKKEKPFYNLRKFVFEETGELMARHFGFSGEQKQTFKQVFDPRYFLLHRRALNNVMYLRESYWYYMEFQLNILFAIFLGIPAFIAVLYLLMTKAIITLSTFVLMSLAVILCWLVYSWLLMRSAEANLFSHRKKELSLLLGSMYFELDEGDDNKETITIKFN